MFYFFAFLPPYIGVSGFLAYPKRWKIKFAVEWCDRELLGRPVARYSAVFVFDLRPCGPIGYYFLPAPPHHRYYFRLDPPGGMGDHV